MAKKEPDFTLPPPPEVPPTKVIEDVGPSAIRPGTTFFPWASPASEGAPKTSGEYLGWLLTAGPRKEIRRYAGGTVHVEPSLARLIGPALVAACKALAYTYSECPKCKGDDLVGWPNLTRDNKALFESARCPSCGFYCFGDPVKVEIG